METIIPHFKYSGICKSVCIQLEHYYLILFLAPASCWYALVESLGDCAQRSWLALALFSRFTRVKTHLLAFLFEKCDSLLLPCIPIGEKRHQLASEILYCDMSSFPLQLNVSVEGCQKEVLVTSTVCLAWISSQAGVIQCALYLWNKLLFTLCRSIWGSFPLRLYGHNKWQKSMSAGYIILWDDAAWGGVWLQSEVRLLKGRNKSFFSHSSVCAAYQGLYLLCLLDWFILLYVNTL